MNVVFAGGGTGGHLYPAIAIADELKKRYDASIAFVGAADRLETTIVPQAGYPLEIISAKPFSKSFKFIFANIKGVFQSFSLLSRLKPGMVIATGGYVCFPFVFATRIHSFLCRTRIPIVLLEPNAQSGLTNRLLTPLVNEVWSAYQPGHDVIKKFVYTGVPVRKAIENIRSIPKTDARARLGLDVSKNVLLVMGGSQGARSINEATIDAITKNLLPDWQVLLISGKVQTPIPSLANLRVIDYLDDMSDAYAAADLVLARAGASTLAELRSVGLPAVLVPYPYAAENHQEANAQALASSGSAMVLLDANLNAESLARAVDEASKLPEIALASEGEDSMGRVLARIDGLLSRT